MTEVVQTARSWGTVQPDTRYDLGSILVRFEVPFGVSYEVMQVLGAPTIKKAIDQFERLGDGYGHKWQHYDRIPIQYDVSSVPTRSALDRFNSFGNPSARHDAQKFFALAREAVSEGMVGMVAQVFFIRPLLQVNLDELREERENRGHADGFMTADEIKHLRETLDDGRPLNSLPAPSDAGAAG